MVSYPPSVSFLQPSSTGAPSGIPAPLFQYTYRLSARLNTHPPVSQSYGGNPGFGINCHPMDSMNPGFIWRVPLVNPLDSFRFTYMSSLNGPRRI